MKCDLIYFTILLDKLKLIGSSAKILFKYRLFEYLSIVYAMFIYKSLLMILLMISFIFLSLFFALWLGDLLGKFYYGFLIISILYFIMLFFLWVFRLKFISRIKSKTIKMLFLLGNQ
jgi:hypothetical protein